MTPNTYDDSCARQNVSKQHYELMHGHVIQFDFLYNLGVSCAPANL